MRASLPCLSLALLLTTLHGSALAYCQSTTCVPAQEDCNIDQRGCVLSGAPLRWISSCVTFAVEAEGSPKWGISFEEAEHSVKAAFSTWVAARCSDVGDHPSLGVVSMGSVECEDPEYNDDPPLPNANAIVFRDEFWPYGDEDRTFALTTLTFDASSGEILDADIEVNSFAVALSTSDVQVRNDLQSIVTHETGHLLGLAHSSDSNATMNAGYDGADLGFRNLAFDDQQGICATYQPGQQLNRCVGAQPRFGFSRVCGAPYENSGCALSSRPRTSGALATILIAVLFVFRRLTRA